MTFKFPIHLPPGTAPDWKYQNNYQGPGSALTGADGSFSITFQQKDTINTPLVRVEKTDSVLHPNYVFFLKQGKIDDVTFLGEKFAPRRVPTQPLPSTGLRMAMAR